MSKVVGEKSSYVLTPISSAAYNKGVSLAGGFSTAKNISQKLIVTLLAIMVVMSGVFIGTAQSSKPAQAEMLSDWFCNSGFNSGNYVNNGRGSTETQAEKSIASIFGFDYNDTSKKLTAYEKYGVLGTNYTTWRALTNDKDEAKGDINYTTWNGKETVGPVKVPINSPYWSANLSECIGVTGGVITGVANFELGITEVGTEFINSVYSITFGSNAVFDGMYTVIDSIVINLRDSLFIPFVELFVILGALWMAYQGLIKRKSTEALTGAVWMICAAIAGGVLLSNPSYIPNSAEFITTQLNGSVNKVITDAAISKSNGNKPICTVTEAYSTTDVTGGQAVTYTIDAVARQTQCSIWYNLVYVPWVVGQYGVSPTDGSDAAKKILAIKEGTTASQILGVGADGVKRIPVNLGNYPVPNNELTWPLVQLNAQVFNPDLQQGWNVDGVDSSEKPTSSEQYTMSVESAAANYQLGELRNTEWAGQGTLTRLNVAGTSMWAMVATGILVITFGFEILALKLALLFLVLMMPIFLLVGVHPGMGRRIAMRWLELITNITIKQVILGILLSVFILFYALVMGSGIWIVQNILIVAITIVGLSYKAKMTGLFANVDFGGDKSIQEPGAGASAGAKRLLAAGVGAGVGAGAAALGAGALAPALAGAASNATGAAVGADDKPENGEDEANSTDDKAAGAGASEVDKAEKARINKVKNGAIRKGAIMGFANGFSGGSLGSAAFTAGNTGFMIGDGAYDNEVDLKRNRDQAEANQEMVREMRMMREETRASNAEMLQETKQQPTVQAWVEQNRKSDS